MSTSVVPFTTVKELPSAFLPYPKGIVIKYRPYLFGEIFAESSSDEEDVKTIELILNGVEVTGYDKYDLSLADVMYIGLLRKISTLGSDGFSVTFVCHNCDKPSTVTKTLFDIAYKDLSVPSLPATITLQGNDVDFAVITVRGFMENLQGTTTPSMILASMVTNYSYEDALDMINNASSEEIVNLNTLDKILDHDIEKLPCKCTHCDALSNVDITDGQRSIIRPFRGSDEPAGAGIRFGK